MEVLMNLKTLNDHSLHRRLLGLVREERELLTRVLDHLAEVERRRLFSDFSCSSLFDYVVYELGYSEDQAHRRIQAMRLIKSVPEVKEKLNRGSLSLTNAAKAQSLFRKTDQSSTVKRMDKANKLSVLKTIEGKSTREAERELLKLQPSDFVSSDRTKAVSPTKSELKVVVGQKTLAKIEEVKALLGPKGADLSHDELLQVMADAAIEKLSEKKFGKLRVQKAKVETEGEKAKALLGASQVEKSQNQRYISQAVKHQVWQRDGGRCTKCRGQRHLQYDHIRPVALGGQSDVANLRLLCFHCNQRAAFRAFGLSVMRASNSTA